MKKKLISISVIILIVIISSLVVFSNLFSEKDDRRGFGLVTMESKNTKSGVPMATYVTTKSILPPSIDWSDQMPTPKDQGKQNSCVGWALGYAYKSFQEYYEHYWESYSDNRVCSPAYLYNSLNGGTDAGVTLQQGLTQLQKEGCLPMSLMPYDETDWRKEPPKGYYDVKSNFKISGYVALISGMRATKDEINEIKGVIVEEPVVIGSMVTLKDPWWEDFFDFENGDNLIDKADAVQIAENYEYGKGASHAMVIVGYDKNKYGGAFKIMNSWGDQWGDGGFFWVSYEAAELTFLEAYRMIDETTDFIENINSSGTIRVETDDDDEYVLPIKVNLYSKKGNYGDYKKYPIDYNTETKFFSIDNVFEKGRDKFQIALQSSDNYCVYFINITPKGTINTIFPKNPRQSAYIYKNKEYKFPSANTTYEFGGTIGKDIFLIVISKNELERYEYNPRKRVKKSQLTSVPTMVSKVFTKLDNRSDVVIYALELRSE